MRSLTRSPVSRVVSVLSILCFVGSPVLAQAPQIQHDPPTCVSTDTFPLVSAEITGDLASARAYFRCEPFEDFYAVEMAAVESGWQAVLPQPMSPPCADLVYYIEGVDASGEVARTALQTVEVGASCATPAHSAPTPSLTVVATEPGVTAFPPGFSEAGFVATVDSEGILSGVGTEVAGGAIGTVGWVLIGAAAVGGTIAIVAATGDDDTSPTQ